MYGGITKVWRRPSSIYKVGVADLPFKGLLWQKDWCAQLALEKASDNILPVCSQGTCSSGTGLLKEFVLLSFECECLKSQTELALVAHTFSPSTRKAEVHGLQVWSQSHASQSFLVSPCLIKIRTNSNNTSWKEQFRLNICSFSCVQVADFSSEK